MSDPFGTYVQPVTKEQMEMAGMPDFHLTSSEIVALDAVYGNKKLEDLRFLLGTKISTFAPSVTYEQLRAAGNTTKEVMNRATRNLKDPVNPNLGRRVPEARHYSTIGRKFVYAVWKTLPKAGPYPEFTQPGASFKFGDTAYVEQCSNVCSLGRYLAAMPSEKSMTPIGAIPVSPGEAAMAFESSGKALKSIWGTGKLRPRAWYEGESTEPPLEINMNATLGFPYLVSPAKDPGALQKCLERSRGYYNIYKAAGDAAVSSYDSEYEKRAAFQKGVVKKFRELEQSNPEDFTHLSKTKEDFNSRKKIMNGMLRPYTATAKIQTFMCARAMQPIAAVKRTYLDGSNSLQGITLQHGGAHKVIDEMDRRLKGMPFSKVAVEYFTMGDDNLLVGRIPGEKGRDAWGDPVFDFFVTEGDVTSYDIGQDASIFHEIHREGARQLALVDQVGGAVWYATVRERSLLIAETIAVRVKHCGPSGLPGQSELINDPGAQVLMQRYKTRLLTAGPEDLYNEEWVNAQWTAACKTMCLDGRLERFQIIRGASVLDALETHRFKFAGYMWFRHKTGRAAVHAALDRGLVQMKIGGLRERDQRQFAMKEASRIAATVLGWGVPPPELLHAHQVAVAHAEELLLKVMAFEVSKELPLPWLDGQESVVAPAIPKTLSGLLAAIQRPPEVLWLRAEGETDPLFFYVKEAAIAEKTARQVQMVRAVATRIRAMPARGVGPRSAGRTPPTAPPRAVQPEVEFAKMNRHQRNKLQPQDWEAFERVMESMGLDWGDAEDGEAGQFLPPAQGRANARRRRGKK